MQEAKSAAIMKLGSSVKVPGFRSGKAPQHLIERQLNANALNQETLEIALTLLYEQALVLHKIRAIGQPEVSLKSFVPFTQLVFVAETDIVGTVKLGEYKGLDVKRESHKVSTAEIGTILKRLQEQAAVKKAVKRPSPRIDRLLSG